MNDSSRDSISDISEKLLPGSGAKVSTCVILVIGEYI